MQCLLIKFFGQHFPLFVAIWARNGGFGSIWAQLPLVAAPKMPTHALAPPAFPLQSGLRAIVINLSSIFKSISGYQDFSFLTDFKNPLTAAR